MDKIAVIKGLELRLDTLISGLESAMPAGVSSLTVAGKTEKVSELIKVATELNQPNKAKRALRGSLREAVLESAQAKRPALELLARLKTALVNLLGATSSELTKFGIKPEAPRKKRAKRSGSKPTTNPGSAATP